LLKCVDFCTSDTAAVYSHLEACLRLGFSFMFVIDFGSLNVVVRSPDQWSSSWGTHAPGGTRRYLRGYAKKFNGVCKIEIYILFRDTRLNDQGQI
jgi:hypothetical protein